MALRFRRRFVRSIDLSSVGAQAAESGAIDDDGGGGCVAGGGPAQREGVLAPGVQVPPDRRGARALLPEEEDLQAQAAA